MSILPRSPKFTGVFVNRFGIVACGLMSLMTIAEPVSAADLIYVTLSNATIVTYDTTSNVGADIAATRATLANASLNSMSTGLIFDSSGNLYVANTGYSSICRFDTAGKLIDYFGPCYGPQGLAIDASSNLYVANYGNSTVSKFDPTGALISNITTNVNMPEGLAIDSSGNLFVTNLVGSTISKFNSNGDYIGSITDNLTAPMFRFNRSGTKGAEN